MASKLIIPIYIDRVGRMLKRTRFSEYYSVSSKVNLKRGTSYRFHVFFMENDHQTLYSLDAGAVVRISMREAGVFDGNAGVLATAESSADPATSEDPYVVDLTMLTAEIDSYLNVDSDSANDLIARDVEFGVSWTEDGWDTKQENNDRVLGYLLNDVNKDVDGTPITLPTAEEWLSGRAVRYDTVQSLTIGQKTQALANLGLPLSNYEGAAAPTADNDSTEGYSLGSRWYDTVAGEVYICVDSSEGAAVWVLSTLTIDELSPLLALKSRLDLTDTPPSAPETLNFWYDTSEGSLSVWNGSVWVNITSGGSYTLPEAHTHVSADITDATSSATPNTVVKRGASGEASFSSAEFTSTTRPTSNGTGTPDANSLITRNDGDLRYGSTYSDVSEALVEAANTTPVKVVSVILPIGTYQLDACISSLCASESGSAIGIKSSSNIRMALSEYHGRNDVAAIGTSVFSDGSSSSTRSLTGFSSFRRHLTGVITVITDNTEVYLDIAQEVAGATVTTARKRAYIVARTLA